MPTAPANNRPKVKDILEMLRTSFGLERYQLKCRTAVAEMEGNLD